MGLCKCPKKRVTSLFCFEHRVPVCEFCVVSEQHSVCVIQSYLKWLSDTDFDDKCKFCDEPLAKDGPDSCIRLPCYDLVHIACLDAHAVSLPESTAPSGYKCPVCRAAVFPFLNDVSPVAQQIRAKLSACSWAGIGLGHSPFSPPSSSPPEMFSPNGGADSTMSSSAFGRPASEVSIDMEGSASQKGGSVLHASTAKSAVSSMPHHSPSQLLQHANPNTGTNFLRKQHDSDDENAGCPPSSSSQRLLQHSSGRGFNGKPSTSQQADFHHGSLLFSTLRAIHLAWRSFKLALSGRDNKGSWTSSSTARAPSTRTSPAHRRCLYIFSVLAITALIAVAILYHFGRSTAEKDPLLDPMSNPNIHVIRGDDPTFVQ